MFDRTTATPSGRFSCSYSVATAADKRMEMEGVKGDAR